MPGFEESARCGAPAEEVWKFLYDPARYPLWWAGMDRIERRPEGPARYMQALPGVPIPTRVEARSDGGRVVISCLMTRIAHTWTLEPAEDGCVVHVRADLPDAEAGKWLDQQREEVRSSLPRLVRAAERAAAQL